MNDHVYVCMRVYIYRFNIDEAYKRVSKLSVNDKGEVISDIHTEKSKLVVVDNVYSDNSKSVVVEVADTHSIEAHIATSDTIHRIN